MDWIRNLRFTQRYKNKEYVLDEQIPTINDNSTQDEIEAHQKHYDNANKVSCIMETSMSPKLQKTFEFTWAYEMNLKAMFQAKASKERLDGLKESRRLKHGELNIVMGNRKITPVRRIGKSSNIFFSLVRGAYQGGLPVRNPIFSKGLKESRRLKHGELNIVMGNRKITPVRRIGKTSSRVSKAHQYPRFYYGFHNKEDTISDSTLSELDEPANYKEAMASPEAAKWKEAMKKEIQSMYDN
nr:hypothetical protein [Tanacetum cinerariifolium]